MRRRLTHILAVVASLASLAAGPAQAFHFPWDQGHDTFVPDEPDPTDPGDDPCNADACPVNVQSGRLKLQYLDFSTSTTLGNIDFVRSYNSHDRHVGPLGPGWTHSFDWRLIATTDGAGNYFILRKNNGTRDRYSVASDGSISPQPDGRLRLEGRLDGTFLATDESGNAFVFDSDGYLTSFTHALGIQLSFQYDSDRFLASVNDQTGRTLNFIKGPSGRIEQIVNQDGSLYSYKYDDGGRLIQVDDPLGTNAIYEYDNDNRLTRVLNALGEPVQIASYDDRGRIASLSDPIVTSQYRFSYDPGSNLTDKFDVSSNLHTFRYNDNGNVLTRTNPLGFSESFEYNDNFAITRYGNEAGIVEEYMYHEDGALSATSSGEHFTFDSQFGTLARYQSPRGSVTNYEYDAGGHLSHVSAPGSEEIDLTTDIFGRTVGFRDGMGATTRFVYGQGDQLEAVIDPLGNQTTYGTGALGQLTRVTDQAGHITQFAYRDDYRAVGLDDNDALTSIIDSVGAIRAFRYDDVGRLAEVEGPSGEKFAFEMDAGGLLGRVTFPGGDAYSYSYDNFGRITSARDRSGANAQFSYDPLGRVTQVSTPDDVLQISYDALGNPTSIRDSDTSVDLLYNNDSQIVNASTQLVSGALVHQISYEYDQNGNRVRFTSSDGRSATSTYDDADRLAAIDGTAGRFTFEYDGSGRRTAVARPNGLVTRYTYDASDHLTEIRDVVLATGATLSARSYSYDPVGNPITVSDDQGAHELQYDGLGRLSGVTSATGSTLEHYEYDTSDNRIASHASAAYAYSTETYLTEDDQNVYEYDANGRLARIIQKSDGRITTLTYDWFGQLTQVNKNGSLTTYRYDGMGRRIEKSVGGVVQRYIYDDRLIIGTLDGSGNVTAQFTVVDLGVLSPHLDGGSDRQLLSVDQESGRHYYLQDATGSVVATVRPDFSVSTAVRYDSFGNRTAQSGGQSEIFGFTGAEFDAETGYYLMGSRYYDPAIGRFITWDLLSVGVLNAHPAVSLVPRVVVFEPEELNGYSYAGNRPLTLTDVQGFNGNDHGKLPGTDVPYRIDWREQPKPDMHVYWPDGSETNITSDGGWRVGKHRGKDLVKPPKRYRKALRKVVKKFVKKAGKLVPVVGIAFWILDAQDAYALTQSPCTDVGDYVNIVVPYKDVGALFK